MKLVTVRPTATLNTIYLHPAGKGALLYEKETNQTTAVITHKHYVNGGSGLIGVFVTKSVYGTGDGPQMRYYHRDHLGSVAVITNPSGAVLERLAYEAFGERRNANGTAQDRSAPLIGITTNRGFTAHEHLDEMNLIHMNGRIYDPALGRFMTSDPSIGSPRDLQSYNRYSYVYNNPLAYTDPTGYWGFDLGIVSFHTDSNTVRTVVAIAAAAVLGPEGFFGVTGVTSSVALSSVIAGAAAGAIMSGNLQGAITGGFSGGLFYWAGGIGAPFSPERIAAHAFAGCINSAAGGGSCGSGAVSAGFAKFAGQYVPSSWSRVGQLVTYAVIGGTASVLGGGKFQNGAYTASFGYLFNQATEKARQAASDASKFAGQQIGDAGAVRAQYEAAVSELGAEDRAARRALKADARAQTPTMVQDIIEDVRPSTDAPPGTSGNASASNARVNALGSAFRVLGPTLVGIGVAVDVYDIVVSPDTYRSMAQAGFGTLGALGGGVAGTVGGTFVMPGAGTVVGGVGGAIGGGQAGRAFGGWFFDKLYRD